MTGWCLIGASTIASEYMIDAIRAQEGHEIVSVLSSSETRGAEFAKKHGIAKSATDLDRLLDDAAVDCVYISTTNELHDDQALKAIAANKHVLCEKPLAMTLENAQTMVQAAQQKGVVFATNHHLRNAGSHQKIKSLIQAGEIGKLCSIRIFHAVYLPSHLQGWRIDNPQAGGGVILDIVVHDADTVRYYLDQDPDSVVAMDGAGSMGQGVEDSCMSVWRMPSGVMVQTHESFIQPFGGTGIEFHGSKGSIRATNVMTQRPVGEITLTNAAGVREISFPDHNLYIHSMDKFAKAIKGEGVTFADGVDGVKSLAVALAVKAAASSGKRMDVDYGIFG